MVWNSALYGALFFSGFILRFLPEYERKIVRRSTRTGHFWSFLAISRVFGLDLGSRNVN